MATSDIRGCNGLIFPMSTNIIETAMAVGIRWSKVPGLLLRGSGSTCDYYAYLLESLVSFSTRTLLHGGELRLLCNSPCLNKSFQCLLNDHELVYVAVHIDFLSCHTFWDRA
ncbi:Uncharacterized protein TCM_013931 [Theobroma cacao]|uniref:Uncharacterized protein n=1 Tax=Theobroma cacao TaxID=3641 RepID=A0A061FXL3_THECC|nr:Uncharacterized protein TCM_013931 [Theobroma cacao]